MATYADSGVNIEAGDQASKSAYQAAKSTFPLREGLIGAPVVIEGGFAGLLDFGNFYLVQNDDGVGTKMLVAEQMQKFETLGYDLVAMVADDAICLGAEVTSITNTIDCEKVEPHVIESLMSGLAKACQEQKIVIPGGEIAELNKMVNGYTWNAAAVGVVAKDRVITGQTIQAGDVVIGLPSVGFRSNGISLVRHILTKAFGTNWHQKAYSKTQTWGEVVLTPCRIFHNDLLELLGRYQEDRKFEFKGLAHITGGGLTGNLSRVLPDGVGAELTNLLPVLEPMQKLMELGSVSREEAYKTWNMGMAMSLIVDPNNANVVVTALNELNIAAQVVGKCTDTGEIKF